MMTPARLEEIRRDLDREAYTSYLPKTVRELLDYIAQLEAQRGGAVVVAEPTPDEWREIAAKAISADLVDFLSGAAAYGLWLRARLHRLRIAHLRRMSDAAVLVERSAEEVLRLEQHRRHREWPHRDVGKLHRRYMRLVRFIAKVDDEIARLRGEG